jgi:uncharacterized protein YjiS (DUF1127 family)
MTIRSGMAMPGIPVGRRARPHATVSLPDAIASRLLQLQSTWMRPLACRRLGRSIAHLDDRLLADIGLSSQDLGFAERFARRGTARNSILGGL